MSAFGQAFEITDDDILAVLVRLGLRHDDQEVKRWADLVETDEAIQAALDCDDDDLDSQTTAAHDELARQIAEMSQEREARDRHGQGVAKSPRRKGVTRPRP